MKALVFGLLLIGIVLIVATDLFGFNDLRGNPADRGVKKTKLSLKHDIEKISVEAGSAPNQALEPQQAIYTLSEYQNKLHDLNLSVRDEQLSWKRSRGYFLEIDLDSYQSYSNETLEDLGRSGDIVALNILADRYSNDGEFEEKLRVSYEAVILGSSQAINNFSLDHSSNGLGLTRENRHDEAKIEYIEGAVWAELAARRGDSNQFLSYQYLMRHNKIKFNAAEIRDIGTRANELYLTMSKARELRGLREYDNTPQIEGYEDYAKEKFWSHNTETDIENTWGAQYF